MGSRWGEKTGRSSSLLSPQVGKEGLERQRLAGADKRGNRKPFYLEPPFCPSAGALCPPPGPSLALLLASTLLTLPTKLPQPSEPSFFADPGTPGSVSQPCKLAQSYLCCDLRWQEPGGGRIPGPARTPSNTGKGLYGKLSRQSHDLCPRAEG